MALNSIAVEIRKIENLKLSPYLMQLLSVVKDLRNAYEVASALIDNAILVNSIEDNNVELASTPCRVEDRNIK